MILVPLILEAARKSKANVLRKKEHRFSSLASLEYGKIKFEY